jgi:hypothetical protein
MINETDARRHLDGEPEGPSGGGAAAFRAREDVERAAKYRG